MIPQYRKCALRLRVEPQHLVLPRIQHRRGRTQQLRAESQQPEPRVQLAFCRGLPVAARSAPCLPLPQLSCPPRPRWPRPIDQLAVRHQWADADPLQLRHLRIAVGIRRPQRDEIRRGRRLAARPPHSTQLLRRFLGEVFGRWRGQKHVQQLALVRTRLGLATARIGCAAAPNQKRHERMYTGRLVRVQLVQDEERRETVAGWQHAVLQQYAHRRSYPKMVRPLKGALESGGRCF
mmetsp:Transcript_33994/g.109829  ORF Transcript_33994/g.109829 Transcript_33994/m.109829 type:complete len:235 (+) Transcript_33994:937-1641(+)|eukprot:scaffold7226_cov115-Isochrysis_galbana.AAC.4